MPSSTEGPSCQVSGCRALLVKDGHYFVRRRVCRKHCTADEICVGEEVVRYCQQCSRIQPVDDFDAGRLSCRASLAAQSRRRRARGFCAAAAAASRHQTDSSSSSGGRPSGTAAATAQQGLTSRSGNMLLPIRAQKASGQPLPAQTQRPQLQPGSVADAMLAAIAKDMAGSPPGCSMTLQEQQHTRSEDAGPSTAEGRAPSAEHALLSGSKRGREAPTAWLLGALEQQQYQQQQLELLGSPRQQQQQLLPMQPPSLPRQLTASDSLSSMLLGDMGALAELATAQSLEVVGGHGRPQAQPPQRTSSSSNSDPAVRRLVSLLKAMPPSAMPLLQQAVQRSRQQQARMHKQESMRRPMMPPILVGPSLGSPPLLAGGSSDLAQLTAPEQQHPQHRSHAQGGEDSDSDGETGPSASLQRLTALFKNLPPGRLPLLRAAMQQAELPRQGGLGRTCGSSPLLQAPPAAGLQSQGGPASPLQQQQQQQLAVSADQGLERLLQQQWLTAQGVSGSPIINARAPKRRALPLLGFGAAPSQPAQAANQGLQTLLFGPDPASTEGAGGLPAQSAASRGSPLLLEELFPDRFLADRFLAE